MEHLRAQLQVPKAVFAGENALLYPTATYAWDGRASKGAYQPSILNPEESQ